MNFSEFKSKYLKQPVFEYPNIRQGLTPLATVKVVTYNHVNFIRECLDSILMQKTNFDFEILIAEDDSNDGTREICIEYAKKYPNRIRLLLNSRENNIFLNKKPSGTFNSVYANYSIQAKYISMIEGDDYWIDENSLQKRVDFLENNKDYVLCYHNAKVFYEDKKEFDLNLRSDLTKSTTLERELIISNMVPTLTRLYRNFLVEIFEEEMLQIVSGDTILKAKLAHFGKAKYLHNIKPAVYRIHKGGTYSSQTTNKKKFINLENRIYILEYYRNKNWEIDYLYEKLFLEYLTKFANNIAVNNKIKVSTMYKALLNFFRSKDKKYCINQLRSNIKTSKKNRK